MRNTASTTNHAHVPFPGFGHRGLLLFAVTLAAGFALDAWMNSVAIAELEVHGIDAGGDSDFAHLPRCLRRITVLSLPYGERCDARWLAPFRNVECVFARGSVIDDETMEYFGSLRGLKFLHLDNAQIPPDALRCLGRCSRLELLTIENTRIDADSLKHLSHCPRLRVLWFSGTAVDDTGIRGLNSPKLVDLKAAGTQLTDAALEHLARLRLQDLDLRHTKATPQGLTALRACATLEILQVSEPEVSASEAETLASELGMKLIFGNNGSYHMTGPFAGYVVLDRGPKGT